MLVRFERIPTVRPARMILGEFGCDIDAMFNGFLSSGSSCMQAPAIDLVERQNESTVVVELPGVAKEDVKISLEEGLLTIKGDRKTSGLSDGARWIRSERSSGEFLRTIQLPHPVKADAVSAEMVNGLLRITLPKAEEARPREIGIK